MRLLLAAVASVLACCGVKPDAHHRWLERVSSPAGAIRWRFGPYAPAALAVAWCESRLELDARNGQYLGLFQMGANERRLYARDYSTALTQTQAAWRYFLHGRDWHQWSCKPYAR